MSNASLKEQLQALSLVPNSSSDKKPHKAKNQPSQDKRSAKQTKSKPLWLEHAQYGVELLKAHYPKCFKEMKEIQPLKVGIKQDLVKALSLREDIVVGDKALMVNSLSYYVNSPSYHKMMVEGAKRIDLDGNPVAPVTAEEAKYSAECRKAKMQKKKPGGATTKNGESQTSDTE